MQQHTGQHVLSAAFDRLFGARTVSFHLGAAASTIDIALELSPRDLAAAEDEANRIVWEDRPVRSGSRLRRRPPRSRSARKPGAQGRAAADRGQRLRPLGLRRHARVAHGRHRRHRDRIVGALQGRTARRVPLRRARARRASGRCATRSPRRCACCRSAPTKCRRPSSGCRPRRRSSGGPCRRSRLDLARYKGRGAGRRRGGHAKGRLVLQALDLDANGLKGLAAAVAGKPGCAAVLVSTSAPLLVVVARAADSPVQANQVLAALTKQFGGRGGGKPEMAQGGGLNVAGGRARGGESGDPRLERRHGARSL